MKYVLGISFVVRMDLLHRAVESIRPLWPHTVVIDNSEERLLRGSAWLRQRVRVYEPPVPFTVPQKFNYLQELAAGSGCDVYLHMHDDGEAEPGSAELFLRKVEELVRSGRKWGIAYTNYDVLSAINMAAVRVVGPWDPTFVQYFSDNDYYWRLHAAGFEHVWTGIPVKHYGSSSTQSHAYRKAVFNAVFPLHHRYYRRKWGGPWFKEQTRIPFKPDRGGKPLTYPPNWKFP